MAVCRKCVPGSPKSRVLCTVGVECGVFRVRDGLAPFVARLLAGALDGDVAEPAVLLRVVPVLDPGRDGHDVAGVQGLRGLSRLLIPAQTVRAQQQLAAAGLRVVDVPVVAAGGGEGDVCEENGLRRVGQRVKEALAGEVLRVGRVRLAEAEETAVCVRAAVGVDLLRLPEGGPGVRPAGVEGEVREDLGHFGLRHAVLLRGREVVGEGAVRDALADERRDRDDRAQLERQLSLARPDLAEEHVVIELGKFGCKIMQGVSARSLFDHDDTSLFQILTVKCFDAVERDDVHSVVEIGVHSAGDEQQLLVAALQPGKGVAAEVARVRLVAVDDEHGAADLIGVGEQLRVEQRQRGRDVPAVGGVERARVVAARGLVVVVVVLDEKRRVIWQRIDHAARALIRAGLVVGGALRIECLTQGITGVRIVVGVKVAVGGHTGHVVHRGRDGGLDARVDGGGVERHAAPAADAEDADALRVDIIAHGQEVDRGGKVLGVDVGRGDIARRAAALAGVRRVKGDGQKSARGELLRVQAGALLLHRAERAAHGHGGALSGGVFRLVEIGRELDAEAVVKRDLAVVNGGVLWERLVPFLGEGQGAVHGYIPPVSVLCDGRAHGAGGLKCGVVGNRARLGHAAGEHRPGEAALFIARDPALEPVDGALVRIRLVLGRRGEQVNVAECVVRREKGVDTAAVI